MNIFRTFEIFLREPLSIFKKGLIQIVNVNSGIDAPPQVNVDMVGQKTQITVVNSDKMYNLLKTVQNKKEEKAAQKLLTSSGQSQVILGQLFGRT